MELKDVNWSLLDGTFDERIKCTRNGSVEILFRIPRKNLAACVDIDELKHGGIYSLFGERDGRQMTYVGHSVGGLFDKLCERDRTDKNFWTEALVFTTTDDSFSVRELVWLENKFVNKLRSAGRFPVKIDNDECPDDIESCAEFSCLAFDIINQKIFAPPKVEPPATQDDEEIFYLSRTIKKLGRKVNAKMKRTPTGYRVLAGSEIVLLDDGNRPLNVTEARRNAKIVDGKLTEAVEFPKPSPAAEFVLGMSANGYQNWKTRDGVTLKNFLGGNLFVD